MNQKDIHFQNIHRLLYKLIGEHYRNRVDLELQLGSDLIDQIWQIPYERLSEKLRGKFDNLVGNVIERIGSDKPFQVLILDAGLSDEEILQLGEAWKFIERTNKGYFVEELENEVISDAELSEISESEHLLQASWLAFRELESRGIELPSVVKHTFDRLNKRFNEKE